MKAASAPGSTRRGGGRRRWLAALGACGLAGLALLAGCGTARQVTDFESHTSFERTFNTVVASMADQKMTLSRMDRRQGIIVGELKGDAVKATLHVLFEGTTRVSFSAEGAPHADDKLLGRVVGSFEKRTAGQATILPPGLF